MKHDEDGRSHFKCWLIKANFKFNAVWDRVYLKNKKLQTKIDWSR